MKIAGINQVTAVAWLTLKDNLRSKVFIILLLTGLAVNSLSVFFPVVGGVDDKVKLVESMCLRSISFFGMLIAALLSSTSIPKDIEDKSVYSIMTKPVNRLNLVLGKTLGFIYIIGITTFALGCYSEILIRYTASNSLPDKTAALDTYDNSSAGKVITVAPESGVSADLTARKLAGNVDFAVKGEHRETAGGINWIEGGKAKAVWTVAGLGLNDSLPGEKIEAAMDLFLESSKESLPIYFSVYNPASGRRETSEIVALAGETLKVKFDRGIIKGANEFLIELEPKPAGSYVGLQKHKTQIFYGSVPFEYNFFKAVVIIFIQIMLITLIGVTGSTFFVTPAVSISFVLFILFCGYMTDYISDFETVIGSFNGHDHMHDHHGHSHGPATSMDASSAFIAMLNRVLSGVLSFITFAMPNLNKFNMENFVLNRIDIPLLKALKLFIYASAYFAACIGISAAVVRRREI